MMDDYTVYAHKTPNNKYYIGITHLKPNCRFGKNGYGYHECTLFWRAIQKYGWDNIEHIILFENLSKEMACLCEQYLIAKYHTNESNYGYNNSLGGESGSYGHKMSEESKQKIIKALTGRPVSEETRRKIGKANSIALKGRTLPPEVRDKISKNNSKAILYSCSNLIFFSIIALIIDISKITLIIFNLFYTVGIGILGTIYDTKKGDLVKECNFERYKEEWVSYVGIYIAIGRIFGYTVMFIAGIFNNLTTFKILLAIVNIFTPVYSWLMYKVEKQNN